jgi:YHS domain-containing protein
MWFHGKTYLFADEPSLDRFSQAPEFYAQRAHEIMATAGR